MSVKIIYFVHGTTTDNIKHKATGWMQGNLSAKGIEQIFKLKEQINLDEIDIVISSDLKRAVDSADYLFNDSKKILNDNPILLISEKEQKAFLPYRYRDVQEYYQKHKESFSSMEDVINKLYILPLSRFKNSSFSRFREAFYLVRNKENGSIAKALDLGLELMFHYDLNPIVIAACRNLDELDIYLDCLQENELSDFDCFEIKFELAPEVI